MSVSDYRWIISITEHAESVSAGYVTEGYTGTIYSDIHCSVTQIDGTRLLKEDELIDRQLYKIECFYEGWTNNIQILFEGKYLYPVRPITINPDKLSLVPVCQIYAATKK